jgi:cytoskeletal protein CcmA (bactofilin family)
MDNKPTNTDSPKEPDSLESAGPSSDPNAEVNALESKDTETETSLDKNKSKDKKSIGQRITGLIAHLNVYLLIFILIVVLSTGGVLVVYQKDKKANAPTTVNTTTLSNEALNQLKSSDATVGDPKQTLTIASNAIFSGKVLIRDSLDVAGSIKVGGAMTLPGLTVSGVGSFDQIQGNNLAISGNASIQGQLTVQKGITSNGGATFGGPISAPQLTVQSLQLSGDIQLVRHIDAGGNTPGKTDGTALGNGGTSSVSGTDTAGTVTINTGGSPSVGCFITVEFVNKFGGTPHVVITPVGSAAAGLNYYTTRNSSSFTICTTNPAPPGQTFSFDYVAID